MANPQDLLNQYLNAAYSSDPKKQDVALTAEAKKEALTAKQMYAVGAAAVTGLGGNAMPTQEENDLLNLNPYEILQKYGQERGIALLTAKYQGVDAYNADDTAYRDTLQTGGDLLNQAISGFGQTIGGIGAWGVGLVSDKGGAALSGAMDDFNRGMSEMRSDASNSTQEAFDARSALREQASTARYNEEIANGSPDWAASLARHGGDAMGAAGDVLTNPTHFADLAAQGVGSMAAIPLIAGELATAVPAGVATRLIAGAIGPTRTAVKAGRAIEKALPGTAAIGLTEAGGTFVQATNEVMNIPQAEIEKLPAYQERIAAGMKPEEARLDMANDAGNQAALMQLPAALVAGAFVSKFEAAPGARRSVTDMLANLGKETLEEGTQSATSQLAVNQAIKNNVDAKRERSAGVGTQFGVGAVAGFGTAGAIQTPGVIAQGVAGTVGAAKKAVDQRLADLHKANEDASPVSESKVRSETETLTAESPNIISIVMDDANYTPEKKTDLVNMVNTISVSILSVNPEELASDPNIPPVVHEAAKNAPNQVDMLSNLARIAMDTKRPMEDRVSAQGFLAQTLSGIDGYFQAIRQDELKDVAEDDVLQNYVSVAERVFASLRSSPAINKALETSNDLMASAVKDTPLTENSTPEQAAIHLAAADLAPETATRESVDTLLKMATKGKLQLNEQQYANLTMLKKLFDNAAAYDEEVKLAGAKPQDTVSRAIKTDTIGVDGDLSALQHAQGIRQALVQGDVEGAKARLEDLGMFAQHMQNKVNALNSHMATKNPTKATAPTFQKLVGTLGNRSFVDSNNTIGVTPTNANSIRQAQLISAEANFVTNAFNILAETFSQLDIQPMELVELDAQLDGRPEELAAQFTAAKEKAKQQPKAEAKPAPAKAEPVQKKAAPEATDLSGYTNHSGGAKGSDSVWDIVGRSFGLGQSLHYYGEGSKTPLGNTPLTPKQLAEADPALIRANKSLGRHYPPKNAYVRSLLQRNYYQVRNSDAVYAIGNIAGKLVEGGTGWAVQMAIDMAKPVYVFNQKDNLWYTFSNGQFVQTGTPTLTKNFAGIGTREITKAGEQAIREVYEKTVSELGKAPAAKQQAAPAPVRSQEVTPEFEQTKLTAIRAMSDADLKRHLKTLTNDLMNEDSPRKARVVEMITAEQEARASLAQETAEPVQQEAEPVVEPVAEATIDTTDKSILTPVTDLTTEALQAEFDKLDQLDRRLSRDEIARFQDVADELERREDQADDAGKSEVPMGAPIKQNDLAEQYPELVGGADNRFVNSFLVPLAPISNLDGIKTPISFVLKGLKKMLSGKENETAALREFQAILGDIGNVKDYLDTEMRRFLKNTPKALVGKTIGMAMRQDGFDPTVYPEGRSVAIAQVTDGQIELNTELLSKAYLAGVSWLMTGLSSSQNVDEEQAARILGITEDEVTEEHITMLGNGITRLQAIDAIANTIMRYWGVTKKSDVTDDYTKGIPMALAANMIDMFLKQTIDGVPSLTSNKIELSKTKHVVVYTLKSFGDSPLNQYRTAIEKLVATKPELIVYMGDNKPTVPKTQLNNSYVENTSEQLKMIENLNATSYHLTPHMYSSYQGLGKDNTIFLFGEPNVDEELTNKNTLLTRKGRNTNIANAWDQVEETVSQMEAQAEEDKIPVENVQVHYGHNTTSVVRAQQLGRYTYQSNKLVRTILSPTRAKSLNLTDTTGEDWESFILGLGQLLGEKVHNLGPEITETIIMKDLNDPKKYQPIIEVLQNQQQSDRQFTMEEVNMFKRILGKPTFEKWQGLNEYARFLNTEDKSQFDTKIYLEADGMSNGPFNAMALYTTGEFTADQLTNLAKCGLYIGGPAEAQTSWVQRQKDTVDLYGTVGKTTPDNINKRRDAVQAQITKGKGKAKQNAANFQQMEKQLNKLVSLLLPKGFTVDKDGNIVSIDRSVPKNPTTITTYGSGKQGIANKLTNALLDSLYERISDAMLARSQDATLSVAQAMFPGAVDADQKWVDLNTAMRVLTSGVAANTEKAGFTVFEDTQATPERIEVTKDYTIGRDNFKTLSNNVRNLLVDPMSDAIQTTLDPSVGNTVRTLRILTQVHGIIIANAYWKRVNELVAANKTKGYMVGGRLSAKQQQEVMQSLSSLHPQIKNGKQNFFIAGSEKADLENKTPYGASFSNSVNAQPTAYGPNNPGVKGAAVLTIGPGDGMMVQDFAQDPVNTERSSAIFDGINLALDFIKQGSLAANKAALNAILRNPMQDVVNTFSAFLEEIDGKMDVYTDMSSEMKLQLGQAMFGFGFTQEEADALTADTIVNYMEGVAANGRKAAIEIQARHNVLSQVNLGMDQMAAAGSPYLVTDKIELVGEPHEIANQLTQLYREELAKLKDAATVADNDADIAKRRPNVPLGISHESGVSILGSGSIKALVDSMKGKVSRPQSLALTQAIKNVVADGYKVISGSYDQLMAYNQNLGANGIDASRIDPDSDQGITLPDRKEIWLLNADSEVLAHEMIHASTFMTILAYMQNKFGQEKHEIPANVAKSIEALQDLMTQFLDSKNDLLKGNVDFALMQDYESASNAIMSALSDPRMDEATRQATALNEYMAWGLANQNLAQAQSKVPVKFTTIVWDTLKAIRNWLIGSNSRNTDDMLSNLAYHTKVVMSASQPSLSAMTKDTSLMMSRVYGHDQRLADLDRTFDQKIADYVTAQGPVQQVRRTEEVGWSGINALHMIGLFSNNGFPMTAQEANTFYKVVAALGTQAKLDPAVMNRMQELYAAATRELTVESFMKDPEGNNPADYGQAEKKYEVIMGQRGVGKDPIGRSTLLPTFMALALTNDTFRAVLAKLPVPRTEASTQERAFDRLLENQANKMLDQLSDVLSGQKRSANVQQAIDNLAYQLVDAAQQSQGFYDQYVTPLGTLADKANATIVESMSKVANKFTTLAEQRRQAGKDRKLIDSAINNGLEVAASIINEEKAGLLGEAILAGANASQSLPKWMHDLIADLVGRVASNADLYDMIKKVRSSIQRLRNQFRTELPKTLAKQFTRKVTKEEWSTMNAALGKSNLAAVVQNGSFTRTDTLAMLGNQPALNRGIRKLEDEIKALDSKFANQYLDKAQQLATFMMTGVPGQHLARNARAIARRLGTNHSTLNVDPALERAIDSLVSLYAVNMLSDADKRVMGSLVQSQKAGVEFTFGYALGLHNQELSRLGDSVNGQAFVNHYKGHMPTLQQDGVSLRISDDKEFVKLAERSYIRKAPYAQSSLDRSAPQSYYFAPVNGRSNFNQGIVQNVRQTMGGVDSITGYTVGGLTGGRITDPRQVARIAATLSSGRYTEKGSNLLPVYNAKGDVVAYERSADPAMLQALNYNTNFGEVMGAWKGRLAEETLAVQFNQVSVEYMAEMYRKDTFNNSANKAQYVDLFDTRVHKKYPVIEDALKLFTPSTVDAIHAQFPDGRFWVRKEMLDNVIGFRSATVGDAWTGNTYWSKETQEAIRKTAMLIFGNKAYANFVNAEQTVQGVVQDAKTLIIVKSIVVPMANIISGMLQLVARGVPYRSILAGLPKKLAETRQYVASEKRAIEAEAELHATTDAAKQRRLKVEIQSIRDSYKRMSIWPLIERGELSSMSDDAQPEDQELVAGKLNAFIEAQVNKLPPAIRAAGKYALITKDTALYKGLRKSVEYGDFLVKAILWDDLVNRQGKDVDYANGRITEEFVNFDRLGGRTRQYLESMGLLWFYNFKIRIAKVGLSIIRNNPLHALMAATIPAPSSIGSPITDNVFSLAVEGRLGYSIGLDQLIGAPMMHPLDNMIF